MSNDFRACENELKKNIEILDGTFSKFGLEVTNVGVDYADMLGGKGIKFYCEIMSNVDLYEASYLKIKVNVYTADGNLISMGETSLNVDEFTGYDTIQVTVFHESIHDEAAKARVYMTK